jgi:PadR family transcriptional regulator, regulatory protein PadR
VELTGSDLTAKTGIPSGNIYTLLHSLEDRGLLKSRWEVGDPVKLGRGLRRWYRITKQGQSAVERTLSQLL